MTKKVVSTLVTLLFTGLVIGQPVKYNSKNGIAIKGFDPVAYFTLGKAVKGLPEMIGGTKFKKALDTVHSEHMRFVTEYSINADTSLEKAKAEINEKLGENEIISRSSGAPLYTP